MQPIVSRLLALISLFAISFAAFGQCPATTPVQGAPLRGAAPLFPATNWWNLDVSSAPVDSSSSSYISFINNGGTRRLHPDFGGEESPGSVNVYGMPVAVVNGNTTTKQAVTFDYWDESDGVNMSTGQGVPFYPIPSQAITQSHWIEGGAPGNVDQRSDNDRHLLIVDCANNHLYELYNVWYNTSQAKWYAGSGAFFDMNTNNRRPDGWTSSDAAGLAVLPGLVRYDEAYNAAVADIGHAFRVTVRATNGYVYPASHRAGSTAGALPMGARLRLKALVNGSDPALRTSDPNIRKIFRAMQKYGLIVADNGSDMYITGTFDTRWNNSALNPAFSALMASDFEVIQLGWNPSTPPPTAALSAVSANPSSVTGGAASTGTVTMTAGAPAGGASVALSSNIAAATVPPSVTVGAGSTSATFNIASSAVSSQTAGTLTATYGGVSKTATFTVNPPAPPPAAALSAVSANPSSVTGGTASSGTVTLTAGAPSGGAVVTLSSNIAAATVLPSVTVAQGATSATFNIGTSAVSLQTPGTLTATYNGVSKTASFTVNPPPPPPAAVLSTLTISPTSVAGGASATGTVQLTVAAPANGATVNLSSSNTNLATVPASVSVPQGALTATFTIVSKTTKKNGNVTISASYAGVTKTATLAVKRR